MKDLLILRDGTFLRFGVCSFAAANPGDRADPGDGRLCLVQDIFRCVDETVLRALRYAGESVPEIQSVWKEVRTGEGFCGR